MPFIFQCSWYKFNSYSSSDGHIINVSWWLVVYPSGNRKSDEKDCYAHACLKNNKRVHDTSGTAGTVNKSLQTVKMNETMLGLNTAWSGLLSLLFFPGLKVFGNIIHRMVRGSGTNRKVILKAAAGLNIFYMQ